MFSQKRAAAYAAAALVAVTFLSSATAQAYQCKGNYVQAEALGNLRVKAAKSAKNIWATQVKNAYGLQWSSWDIAASKSQDCNWTGNKFYCIVKAMPCLYVVQ